MNLTGTLQFDDIGTGIWYLQTEDTKYRLFVDSLQSMNFKPGLLVEIETQAVPGNSPSIMLSDAISVSVKSSKLL